MCDCSTISWWLAAWRALHFLACLLPVGLLTFHLLVAAPVFQARSGPSRATTLLIGIALLLALVSGIGWLLVIAGNIGDVTPVEAMRSGVVTTVLNQTQFGATWRLRAVFWLIATAASAWMLWRKRPSLTTAWTCLIASAALLASLAWAGHGVDGDGNAATFHVIADATHLLAGGLWPFGLAPFAVALFKLQRQNTPPRRGGVLDAVTEHSFPSPGGPGVEERSAPSVLIASQEALQPRWGDAAALTRRFSAGALICVVLLTFTGLVNCWFMFPSISSLWRSGYGRMLLLKIAVFLPMIVFAAMNRLALKPRLLAGKDPVAVTIALRRNVIIEFVLANAVILIVALLGLLMPPMP